MGSTLGVYFLGFCLFFDMVLFYCKHLLNWMQKKIIWLKVRLELNNKIAKSSAYNYKNGKFVLWVL
jgi:hypothetical protein